MAGLTRAQIAERKAQAEPAPKPVTARADRAGEVRMERRRRSDETLTRVAQLKMALPPEFRDDKHHTYRWVNDVDSRVYDLTQDTQVDGEWDVCSRESKAGEDATVRKAVGTKEGGAPLYAVLCRKPMWIHLEDQAAKEKRRKAQEKGLVTKAPDDPENPQAAAFTYVAEGTSIKSGAFTP